MDLVTVFRICFIVGLVLIPILYFLFGRKATRRNERTGARDADATPSEEYGGSAEATK